MEKERLKYNISRFDQYYSSVNSKCSIILGISTFIVGIMIASLAAINKNFEINLIISLLYFFCIGLGISAMLVMIIASTPYLKSKYTSVFFFYSISKQKEEEFFKKSEKLTPEQELQDLRYQNYTLAKGLTSKFKNLKIASILLTILYALLVPLTILLIQNIK